MSIIMRYANEDTDKDDLFWKARLTKNFELETLFEVSEKFGSKKRSVQLILDNRDQELTALHESYSLLNKAVILYYDDPAGVTKTFTGVVTELNKMGLDVEITIGEQFSLYMQQPIPDLQVAVDYYSDKGINENWNAAPIIIGNVNRLKTQWVDLVFSRYIIGSGPLASIDKVYFDDVIMYDKTRTAAENIFQLSDESKKVGVIIWRGTGWEDDPETQTHPYSLETVESVYPGVAYLEFYDADTGEPTAPVNADGSACEVYVDVKGISDPDTEPADPQPERNPAKILYQLATNPVTCNDHAGFAEADIGERGFGLAIDPTKIDFDDAITFCTTNNIVIDGIIAQRKEASEWFDELAKYCMATFKEIEGVFTLIVDEAADEVVAHFSDDGINAYNCIIGDYSEPSYDKQINRIRLYYGYNVETDKFDKRPSGSEESPIAANSQYLRNESHYLKLLKWNTDKYEYKFVQDDATAHKIAQYNFKRNILQLKTVDITIGFDVVDLDILDVISITSVKHDWDRKQFRIKKIVRGDKGIKLTCLEYDANVYMDNCSGELIIPSKDYLNTPRPDKATLNSVIQRVDISEDGAANVILTFDFDLPENASYVNIHYKEYDEHDASPDTGYGYIGSANNSPFEIKWLFDLDKQYRMRLVSVAGNGARSFISKETGDKHYIGQPGTESYIEIVGDSEAPGKPIVTTTPIPYGVVLGLSVTGGTPADFSHYEISRKIEDGELEVINPNVKTQIFTDVNNEDLPYDRDIQYQVRAFDNTGNASVPSDLTTAVQVKFIVGDDITGEPIIAKDFRTSAHVGEMYCGEYVKGVKFDSLGIQGYNSSGLTFNLEASTGDLYLKGEIEASSGKIGGWTIDATSLYAETTGTIKTSSTVGYGTNGVILDKDGLRGYDATLGLVFNLPSNGDSPTFSSGTINESIFEISTNAIIRTSSNAVIGSCGVGEAGVLINNTGIYASDDTTVGAENAKVRLLSNGEFYLQSDENSLTWDGSSLSVKGEIYSSYGTIGGWTIGNTQLNAGDEESTAIVSTNIDTENHPGIVLSYFDTGISQWTYLSLGRQSWENQWKNAWGVSIGFTGADTDPIFAVGQASLGDVYLPDAECAALPQGTNFFWVGNATNYIRWRSDTDELKLSGTIYSTNAKISGNSCFGDWHLCDNGLYATSSIELSGDCFDCRYNWQTSQFIQIHSSIYCDDGSLGGLRLSMTQTLLSPSEISVSSYDGPGNKTNFVSISYDRIMSYNLSAGGIHAIAATSDGCIVNDTSDSRLKCEITNISNSLNVKDIINAINPIYYKWDQTNEFSKNRGITRQIGLLAQEIQELIPEVVTELNNGYLSLDYSRLIPVLIEAQKDLYNKIQTLEDQLKGAA